MKIDKMSAKNAINNKIKDQLMNLNKKSKENKINGHLI